MGIFKKRQEPQTFEEYVAYFDALPAERRNRYLKYFECFDTMKSTLFTNYENMTDFYDYEGYRLDCIAKKLKAPRGEGHIIYSFLGKFHHYHFVQSVKHELVEKNGEFAFNLCRIPNKPEYFKDNMLYFSINPNNQMTKSADKLTIIASNKKDYTNGHNTYFFIEEESETVYNVNQYWDETTKGVEDINQAGKIISSVLDSLKNYTCHTIDFTTEPEKLEVWNRLIGEAKELTKATAETKAETTTDDNRDKK